MKYFEAVVHKLSYITFQLAKVCLILMALLTTVDVVGRYVFNNPILGAQEISELLMVFAILGGMGWATHKRAHIRADLITARFSKRKYAVFSAVGFFITLLFVILMVWQSFKGAIKNLISFDQVTSVLGIPIAPFQFVAAIFILLLCLELLIDVKMYIQEAIKND